MKFTEIEEAMTGADIDKLSKLKREIEQLKNIEVTRSDVDSGKATEAEYSAWLGKYNKVADAAMKIEIQSMDVKGELEREGRLSKASDPKVQKAADRFHKLTCTMDHTERCGYHYGNWDNDVRGEMLDAYERVQKVIDRISYRGLRSLLDHVEKGEKAKIKLEKFQ